jgi:hypothetical protein
LKKDDRNPRNFLSLILFSSWPAAAAYLAAISGLEKEWREGRKEKMEEGGNCN